MEASRKRLMVVDRQTKYNAEAALVDLLTYEITQVLSDRGADRHPPPWTPKQEVQIGVLRPRFIRQKPADDSVEPVLSDPDVLGVDFVVKPESGSLTLEVDVSFAIYLPDVPSYEEAVQMLGGDDASQGHPGSSSKTRVPLQYAWRRVDLEFNDLIVELLPTGVQESVTDPISVGLRDSFSHHFLRESAARAFKASFTVPVSALNDDAGYREALASSMETNWIPTVPTIELSAYVEPLPDNSWLVSVSLTNLTVVDEKTHLDLCAYDARLEARIAGGGSIESQRFDLAPDDYRYEDIADVPGHGRGCVAVATDLGVATETLPTVKQLRVEPRHGHVPDLLWTALADEPMPILDQVTAAMYAFAAEWDGWISDSPDPSVADASREDLATFQSEIRTFENGIAALNRDPRLAKAFRLANQSFAKANQAKPYDSWRPFQLVYIVSHLSSLSARESNKPEEIAELDVVDVLWYPTGGGKTEAYLGLVLVAAFFDRLRGKSAGVTAWLKFPLRMLSVQQLIRVLRVLAVADDIRQAELPNPGAPFELGFLVGGGNTPNSLRWESRWWPGFKAATELAKIDSSHFNSHRLVGQCPYCLAKGDAVGLAIDADAYRLVHECSNCGKRLPLHITDDEVYRYQPTVVVSTIDKVTGFSRYGDFTSFNWGPRKRCPKHGYFAFGECPEASEPDRGLTCSEPKTSYDDIEWTDPVPALTVQDEMHLVREDLGVFAAHFEGLIAELQLGGPSELPTKILGATATIEQFQDQLRQVYGRRPRRFPSPGYDRARSFYTETLAETRRVFLGVMPTGSGVSTVETAGRVQRTAIQYIHELQNDLDQTASTINSLIDATLKPDDIESLLFDYEVSLGFVNSKNAGAQVTDEIVQLSARLEAAGEDRVRNTVLSGEVDVPELAETIDRVEDATLSIPRSDRLRAIVGTSVVSHGVDLERLNVMVMAGLPSTTADYIQATSRSGRTHVGLIVTVYTHFQRREASSFSHFLSAHRLLDILVEPVPVNRYAERAVERTLPAIAAALLWDLARNPRFAGPADGIRRTPRIKKWWNAAAPQLEPELERRIEAAYRSVVPGVNPLSLETRLTKAAVNRWVNIEKLRMEGWNGDNLTDLFGGPVMTSLRDVDIPIEFGGSPTGRQIYRSLFPERGQ